MNNMYTFDTSTLWAALPEIFLLSAIVVVLFYVLFNAIKLINYGNISVQPSR